MKKILYVLILLPSLSWAGFQSCHNGSGAIVSPSSSTAICVTYAIPPFSATDYDRVKGVLKTVPRQYTKWTTEPVEMTQGEKDAVDASKVTERIASLRASAQALYDGQQAQGLALRSLVDVLLDEINILRTWIRDFKTATADANNLSTLKTGVAGLPNLPDRTLSQAKSSIQSGVLDGSVDE